MGSKSGINLYPEILQDSRNELNAPISLKFNFMGDKTRSSIMIDQVIMSTGKMLISWARN